MDEETLIPLFESIGVVVQFRLMMHHSGLNRGIGYVTYADPIDGDRAIFRLNDFMVSSEHQLQLFVSKNVRRLWLGYVNVELDKDSVIDLIYEKVDPDEVCVMRFW